MEEREEREGEGEETTDEGAFVPSTFSQQEQRVHVGSRCHHPVWLQTQGGQLSSSWKPERPKDGCE